jgi:hypothetical protein
MIFLGQFFFIDGVAFLNDVEMVEFFQTIRGFFPGEILVILKIHLGERGHHH